MNTRDESLEQYLNMKLSLDENDKIVGEIYLITNIATNMKYVGQTMSHRKNKGKYVPFGYMSRYQEHLKGNKSRYDSNTHFKRAINKYGIDNFRVELLTRCPLNKIDELERYYISHYNTFGENGYNLTRGGSSEFIRSNGTNKKIKKPTEEVIQKRVASFKKTLGNESIKKKWVTSSIDVHQQKRMEIFKDISLPSNDNLEQYIVKTKQNYGKTRYFIEVNGKKTTFYSRTETDDQVKQRAINFLQSLIR
jgi:hypothetical protein